MSTSGIMPIPAISVSAIETQATVSQLSVVGWQFVGQQSPPTLTGSVSLLPEPTNPIDQGAVLVLEDGIKVGYLLRKTIGPVHFLLANFLTQLRAEEGYHTDEMELPLLINLIQPDDRGRIHGSLRVVGLDRSGDAESFPVILDPIIPVERFTHWEAELLVTKDGEEPVTHRRSVIYPAPVSLAMVRNYCGHKYPDLRYVSAVPTSNP